MDARTVCLLTGFMSALVLYRTSNAIAADDARVAKPHDKDHPALFRGAADFADRAAWEKRAEFLRHQVLVSQGLWPMPVHTPIAPNIHGKIERDGYTVENVFFASLPGHYVTGNLYRPTGRAGKLPAILSPYGHWPNGRFIWNSDDSIAKELKSGAETTPEGARTPLQARCAMLARMGCIVFHYDLVGYCDSTKIPHRQGFTDVESILRLQSFMGLQAWNSIRSLDFLLSLPDADPDRIGVTGASGGATQTILVDAVDPRPAAAFPVVMVSMNMQGGCVCENAPLLRVGTNNVELASLFAPKPQGMAAAKDWTSDFEKRGLPEMKSIWKLFGAEADVEGKFFPYPHNYNVHSREMMYDFMNAHLKLDQKSPVREQPFVPVPPAQLSAFDKDHPLPADAVDAPTLRKTMTQASDAQLAELAKDNDAWTKMIRVALEAMIVDRLPSAGDVEIIESSAAQPPTEEGGEWTGVLSRKGAGERVAFRAIFPRDWKGDVIVWAHPDGCASLSKALALVDRGSAVLAIDPFITTITPPKANGSNPAYAGFELCYNRSVVANRAHDLLSAIAMAKGWNETRSVKLAGFAGSGVEALLTRCVGGDAIDRAVIDLDQFDFDRVTEDVDPMLLPGALKYGGVGGWLPLCTNGHTRLHNRRRIDSPVAPAVPAAVVEAPSRLTEAEAITWLTN